jgi:branched-chain amino acid transport system permease protein
MMDGPRSNELRMELLGYDVRRFKLVVFVIGGAVAGLGGGLFAAWGTFVNPSVFSLAQAASVVVWVMIGGRGSLIGSLLGVFIVQSAADAANLLVSQQTPLLVGLLLIAVVTVLPDGVVPAIARLLPFKPNRLRTISSRKVIAEAAARPQAILADG